MYSIDERGKLHPVRLSTSPLEDSRPLSVTHVLDYPLSESLALLVDSFNDTVEVVESDLVSRLRHCQESLPVDVRAYLRSRFSLEGWLPRAKERYAAAVAEQQRSIPLHLTIVMTYGCNMRCTYCYQQHASTLAKTAFTADGLHGTLEAFERRIAEWRSASPDQPVVLGLFGGEPFQRDLKPLHRMVFEFARRHRCHVSITTNGVEIDQFYDLLAPYHGYVAVVHVTIDGGRAAHERRRVLRTAGESFDRILRSVASLLRLGIQVKVAINIDRLNVSEIRSFLDVAQEHGWINHPLLVLEIGRVDDRKYEIPYARRDVVLTEAELLEELLRFRRKAALPDNLRAAFLKTSLPLARRFGLDLRQNEFGRLPFQYCWATSPGFDALYADPHGRYYRCTYTIGDEQWACGTLSEGADLVPWHAHGLLASEACMSCPLGGYCAGGCRLSSSIAPEARCREERRSFRHFAERILVPHVREMLPS